ncbi:MAG: cardiolipin synthase ClsB [Betaproteobacteria bacterium]|nr:cardiolipin synthase ClsB [Betaproteobacteria bacterium]
MKTGFTDGNRVTLLKNGAQFFPALVSAIESAQLEVRLETYIFHADASGQAIRDALAAAARRGVAVRVMVDGIGSRDTPMTFFDALTSAGATVLAFRPDHRPFRLNTGRMRRNHRKIALIDGRIGFVGGINIIDDLTESLSEHPRFDYAARVEGPVLADIHASMHLTWRWVAWRQWRRRDAGPPDLRDAARALGTQRVRFVARDNFRHRRDIERAYQQAIEGARERVLIMCPYFLPGRRFRRALIKAARRGVAISLLLQGRADHPLLQMATRALYAQLLGQGVTIHEYDRSMLHGKVACVDDRWATVGSSNLDPFSLLLNREANLVIEDPGFARLLRESIELEMHAGARLCSAAAWEVLPWWVRAKNRLAYVFSRWVVQGLGLTQQWD